jgi:MoaA/NifB/PqqE/SkfB family radical SAM enzyme
VEIFETRDGSFLQGLRDLPAKYFVGSIEDLRRFLIPEGNLAVGSQNTDTIIDLAENFREVRGRKHEIWNIVSRFEFRNSNVLSCSTPYSAFAIGVRSSQKTMKWQNKLKLRHREIQMILRGLTSTKHVLLAHIIPMRRCNLACAYCNEYDDFSPPIPTDEMIRRIDRLAFLKTAIVTISGGEPLMHPELEIIIQRIRHHGMIAGLITNGYLLTPKRIVALNQAGLEHLQISIDNVHPDEVSMKSLKVLDKKLEYLADYAEFAVNINSVIGGGIKNPEDALTITHRAVQLGFASSLGIIHDGNGSMKPLNRREEKVYREIKTYGKSSYSRFYWFQENLARGIPNEWRCRAGARYLYICEDGLVHYCSQQRGFPGIPLEKYTFADIEREYFTKKTCAPNCTVGCVQKISVIDHWRDPQAEPSSLSVGVHP